MAYLRHKFSAKRTEFDGIKFPSKLQATYYAHLQKQKIAGKIIFFLREVPLHLPGGTKLVVDFVLFNTNGTVSFQDTKGIETDSFKIKRREVEAHYGIKIEIVKKGEF